MPTADPLPMFSYLAQAAPDISQVPSDFVQNWWIMLGFAMTIWMQWRNGQSQKREVSGQIVTEEKEQPATKKEVNELKRELAAFVEQNNAEHRAAISAGEQRVVSLSSVLDRETSEMESALTSLGDKLTQKLESSFELLHNQISPLIPQCAATAALLEQVEKRTSNLEARHVEEVSNLHKRIDDAVRAASAPSRR